MAHHALLYDATDDAIRDHAFQAKSGNRDEINYPSRDPVVDNDEDGLILRRNETWGFGDDDVDHAEGAAGGEVEADVEITALAFDNVRHNFTDPLGLDRAHRSWAVLGIG